MKKINLMLLFLTISVFLLYGISLSAIEEGKKPGSTLKKSTAITADYAFLGAASENERQWNDYRRSHDDPFEPAERLPGRRLEGDQ